MSKEKQIEEMAKHCPCYFGGECCFDDELPEKCDMFCQYGTYAEILYNAGYRKQSEWISVDERLPESRFVIVCDEYGDVGEAYFCEGDGRFEWISDDERAFVTHWMPLPEAPKMKGGVTAESAIRAVQEAALELKNTPPDNLLGIGSTMQF